MNLEGLRGAAVYFVGFFIAAALLLRWMLPVDSAAELSILAVFLVLASLMIFLFWLTDRLLAAEVDTMKLLNTCPNAYASFLRTIAILLCAALVTSAVLVALQSV